MVTGILAAFSTLIIFLMLIYRSSLRLLSPDNPFSISERIPCVTIVVPTYNEEDSIEGKLENLESIDYPDDGYNVVVVDGGSDDRTVEKAKKYVRTVDIGERRKLKALNKGMELSDDRYVLFTDADVLMRNDALNKAVKYLDDGVGAVGAVSNVVSEGCLEEGKKEYYREDWWLRCRESEIDSACSLDGKFILLDTSATDHIDEDSFTDDQQITLDLWRRGYRSLVVDDVEVKEFAEEGFKEDINQMRRRCRLSIGTSFSNLDILLKPSIYSWWIFPLRRLLNYMLPFFLFFISLFMFLYNPVYLGVLIGLDAALSIVSPRIRYYNFLVLALTLSWTDILTGNLRKGCRWSY